MKTCSGCCESKDLAEFTKSTRYKDGLHYHCRSCLADYRASRADKSAEYGRQYRKNNRELVRQRSKEKHIRYYYGLSKEAFSALLVSQNGECAICHLPLSETRMVVDHDHRCCPGSKTCGSCVRGILCVPCNTGIGMLRDDYHLIQQAATYLAVHEEA